MNTNGKGNNNSQQTYRILSLDGGGIRGLITAVWLDRLEQKLGGPEFDVKKGLKTRQSKLSSNIGL